MTRGARGCVGRSCGCNFGAGLHCLLLEARVQTLPRTFRQDPEIARKGGRVALRIHGRSRAISDSFRFGLFFCCIRSAAAAAKHRPHLLPGAAQQTAEPRGCRRKDLLHPLRWRARNTAGRGKDASASLVLRLFRRLQLLWREQGSCGLTTNCGSACRWCAPDAVTLAAAAGRPGIPGQEAAGQPRNSGRLMTWA